MYAAVFKLFRVIFRPVVTVNLDTDINITINFHYFYVLFFNFPTFFFLSSLDELFIVLVVFFFSGPYHDVALTSFDTHKIYNLTATCDCSSWFVCFFLIF